MEISVADGETYIPAVGGNDKSEKPVTFRLQYLTVEDQTEIAYYEVANGKGRGKVSVRVNSAEYFRRGVASIENLTVNGRQVTTADEFLAVRGSQILFAMQVDVANRINKAMEIDEKN